tara:strand:+ start:307 stop:1434 length:1128 start_codon:yes stop_codon:yes gene_type:complete
LKKFSIQKNIRFLKSLKASFNFISSSWEESRSMYHFNEANITKEFFNGIVKCNTISDYVPYPILVSSASGLSLIIKNKIFNLLNTNTGFYVFGIAASEDRIFLSINFHFPIKSNINNLINKRITILLSTKIKNIFDAIKGDLKLINWETHYSNNSKNYSYINYFNDKLYAADYLGTIDVFNQEKKNKFKLIKNKSYNLLKNKLHYPNYFYPFLHVNCVTINRDYIYCGLHAYSKITKYNSSMYRIDRNNNIYLEKDTNFISAHDLMRINNDFYGCDSDNGKFYKNDKCIFKSNKKSFFRGLSVNKNGYVLGSSIYSKRRSQREIINVNNKILFLNNQGKLIKSITPRLASIYRIFALNVEELSQSSPVTISIGNL